MKWEVGLRKAEGRVANNVPVPHSAFRIPPSAFSLLEVILSLAILAGALVVIGEYARQGTENARMAQDLTQAQFLCESKLAEITAGLVAPESNSGETLTTDDGETWICSVEASAMEDVKLLSVMVTVTKQTAEGVTPVSCSLTRWMPDPNATGS